MRPATATSAGQAASLLLHPGYAQAADAALATVAAVCAVAVVLTRWAVLVPFPVPSRKRDVT